MAGENVISSMVVQISAQNTASAELTKVGKDMNTAAIAGRSMGEKIGDASASFAKMGYTVNSAMMMLDRFEVSQLSLDSANVQVAQSQRRHNEAVSKYGENSSQAQTAAASLAVAQNSLNSANIRANSSMILIGLSALAMVPQFFAAGKALVTFATTGKIAIAGLSLTMSTMAPYLIVIGAALGVLYYWYTKNTEASYALRSESDVLIDTTGSLISALASAPASLSDLEKAQWLVYDSTGKVNSAFEAWQTAIDTFGENSPEAKKALLEYTDAVNKAAKAQEALKLATEDTNKVMGDTTTKEVPTWKSAFMDFGTSLVSGIVWAFDTLLQKSYEFGQGMRKNLDKNWEKIKGIAAWAWEGIKNAIIKPIQDLWNWLFGASIIPDIVDGFTSAWDKIKNFTITAWDGIKNAIISPITNTWTWLVSAWNSITTALGNAWGAIKTLASEKWTAIKNAIWGALPKWLQDMILGIFTWTWPALPDWSAAWSSMLNSIYAMLPSWFKVLLGLEDAPTPYSDWSNSGGGGGGWSGNWVDWSGDSGGWDNYTDSGWSNGPVWDNTGWSGDTTPMQEGGIVTKPTRALIGEAGPEAIIPLPGYLKGGGMGAVNVTLNIGTVYGVDDLEAAIQQAFENLKWRIRAGGG